MEFALSRQLKIAIFAARLNIQDLFYFLGRAFPYKVWIDIKAKTGLTDENTDDDIVKWSRELVHHRNFLDGMLTNNDPFNRKLLQKLIDEHMNPLVRAVLRTAKIQIELSYSEDEISNLRAVVVSYLRMFEFALGQSQDNLRLICREFDDIDLIVYRKSMVTLCCAKHVRSEIARITSMISPIAGSFTTALERCADSFVNRVNNPAVYFFDNLILGIVARLDKISAEELMNQIDRASTLASSDVQI